MFSESIFESACATSITEVLLIIVGSFIFGLILGYLIWGWVKNKLNELEQRIIELNRSLTESRAEVERLGKDNARLTEEVSRFKNEADLKSAQYASAISRIKKLEENDSGSGLALDNAQTSLQDERNNIEALQSQLTSEQTKLNEARIEFDAEKAALAKQKSGLDELKRKMQTKEAALTAASQSLAISKEAPQAETPIAIVETPLAKVNVIVPTTQRKGRPKKIKTEDSATAVVKKSRGRPRKIKTEDSATPVIKKGRGRPRKIKTEDSATPVVKKGRGRPRKIKTEDSATPVVKKGRGRPRKIKTEDSATPVVKKGRGRPKKIKTQDSTTPVVKKGRGRPRKVVEEVVVEKVKKRRGRPRKNIETTELSAVTKVKRGRGRPKKESSTDPVPVKGKRGRPRKVVTEEVVVKQPKKGRGRPRKDASAAQPTITKTVKKGRGRPKKVATDKKSTPVVATPKRRGRPKKIKVASAVEVPAKRRRGRPKKSEGAPVARVTKGRGRPKGSKNVRKKLSYEVIPKASDIFGKRVKENDLTLIEGIGPKIAKLFQSSGLNSWEQMAKASQKDLRSKLEKMGPRHHIHDPATWARQSQMAMKGEWKKLKVYQDSLKGGRKS